MIDGFWTVKFQGTQGGGGGVAVFTNGKIFGGDSGYTYTGTYQESNNQVKAKVSVQNFVPGVPNVMGRQGNFDLEFSGTASGDTINGTANLAGQPAAKMNATMTKKSNL
jgi:T3SS negative regulator,GrlR